MLAFGVGSELEHVERCVSDLRVQAGTFAAQARRARDIDIPGTFTKALAAMSTSGGAHETVEQFESFVSEVLVALRNAADALARLSDAWRAQLGEQGVGEAQLLALAEDPGLDTKAGPARERLIAVLEEAERRCEASIEALHKIGSTAFR